MATPDGGAFIMKNVRRATIRDAVLAFAKSAGAAGFIDHDLRAINPDAPESSIRKRRSELTQQGIIVNTGNTRTNENGVSAFIFKHRDHTADKQNVYIGSAAQNPLTEAGLREALRLARKRNDKSILRMAEANEECARAGEALYDAECALDSWLARDEPMVLL